MRRCKACFLSCFSSCDQEQPTMGSTTSSHLLPIGSAPAALIVVAAITCRKRLRAGTCSSSSCSSIGSRSEGGSVTGQLPQRSSLLFNDSSALVGDTSAGATSMSASVGAISAGATLQLLLNDNAAHQIVGDTSAALAGDTSLGAALQLVGDTSAGATSTTASVQASQELPQQVLRPGTIGRLGAGCLPEHRGRPSIVTEVAASHCTVCVLDGLLQSVLDQCWPNLADFAVEQRLAEMGSRVVVQGLKSKRTQWCNSLTGTVVAHPTKGHPCFIQKAGSEHPLLVLCVKLDDPPPEGQKQVLMELRFLVPMESALKTLQGS